MVAAEPVGPNGRDEEDTARRLDAPAELGDESRLPDAGLAGDEDRAGPLVDRALKRLFEAFELSGSTDEQRTGHSATDGHRAPGVRGDLSLRQSSRPLASGPVRAGAPTQTCPSAKCSAFHIGARAFVSSIAYRAAWNASSRCGRTAPTATLGSPSGTLPVRWTIATRSTPYRSRISSAISPRIRRAIVSWAS